MKISKVSLSDRLAGKPLIGFESRAARAPRAMVGATPTVEGSMKISKGSVSQRLAGKPLIGFDSRAPRTPSAMVGGPPTVKPAS